MFSFFTGLFSHTSSMHLEYGQLLGIMIIISTISTLSAFLILNVDAARWFGVDGLNIPGTMKRSSFVLLAMVILLIFILSFSSLILEAVEAVLYGVFRLIVFLLNLLAVEQQPEDVMQRDESSLFPDSYESASEPSIIGVILMWLVVGVLILAIITSIVIAMLKLIRFIMRLLKAEREKEATGNEVFTEIIEKISLVRKKRAFRGFTRQPRYSSLLTERERILYIYREYVKRAKRNGFTDDSFSDTANEILEEISQNANRESFPLPDDLSAVFNAVRYSNDSAIVVEADKLRRRLIP